MQTTSTNALPAAAILFSVYLLVRFFCAPTHKVSIFSILFVNYDLIGLSPQLRHIPTIGSSNILFSYLDAFRYFRNAHEIVQEGYEKVKGIFVHEIDWMCSTSHAVLWHCVQSLDHGTMAGCNQRTRYVRRYSTSQRWPNLVQWCSRGGNYKSNLWTTHVSEMSNVDRPSKQTIPLALKFAPIHTIPPSFERPWLVILPFGSPISKMRFQRRLRI